MLTRFFNKRRPLLNAPLAVFSAYALAGFFEVAQAQGITVTSAADINSKILCPLFNAMFTILIVLSIIMAIIGAYYYVTAGDNAEKVSKGNKTLTYAAVAVVVALIAKGFPLLIAGVLGASGVTGC